MFTYKHIFLVVIVLIIKREAMFFSSYVEPYLLSSQHVKKRLIGLPVGRYLAVEEWYGDVFLSFREANKRVPDHVFNQRWRVLSDVPNGTLIRAGLGSLANVFLNKVGDKVYVKLDLLHEWQHILSRISALPILAAFLVDKHSELFSSDTTIDLELVIKATIGTSTLIYPYSAKIDHYIAHKQLNETHMHLNGTATAEVCWFRALHQPEKAFVDFQNQYHQEKGVKQLLHQICPDLTPNKLSEELYLAIGLRRLLVCFIKGGMGSVIKFIEDIDLVNCPPSLFLREIKAKKLSIKYKIDAVSETLFLGMVIQKLKNQSNRVIENYFNIYILIMHQYIQLTVQREDLLGFDQFQNYTLTDLRENEERKYLVRYQQIHGNRQDSQVGWFEGRLAPKAQYPKMEHLLMAILGDYSQYLKKQLSYSLGQQNFLQSNSVLNGLGSVLSELTQYKNNINRKAFKLALVVHFVKMPENMDQDGRYRYWTLRHKLAVETETLNCFLIRYPSLHDWIRGVDAAANELHTPPEIFSSIFRVLRAQGIPHASYHVGEDFNHILSGIRVVDDTIRFLDYQEGDRIGHGTSIGIWPEVWHQYMPEEIKVTIEEWLLTLLFVWRRLGELSGFEKEVENSRREAVRLINKLYSVTENESFIDIEQAWEVFSLRDLWPEFFIKIMAIIMDDDGKIVLGKKEYLHYYDVEHTFIWRAELIRTIDVIKSVSDSVLKLYLKWLTHKGLRLASQKVISVSKTYLSDKAVVALQDYVLACTVKRRLIIETLPTSNVRISQYKDYADHHLFRWIGLEKRHESADILPLVSLGSDDPGLFANNLVIDFYHIYSVLINHYGLSDSEAIDKLSTINERGDIYRFHSKNIS